MTDGKWVPLATYLPPVKNGRNKSTLMLISEPPDPVWPGMSRADYLRIASATRWTADQMGLRDWGLNLRWEPSHIGDDGNKDCFARIEVEGNMRRATIWLHEDFAHMPEDEQRRVLCHEMLHIHLAPLMEIGEDTLADLVGTPVNNLFVEEMHRAVERACEAMAMNWSRHLDEIPASLSPDDDIAIILSDGREVEIGEYLGLEAKDAG